tara:strand:+ start:9794 stop:11362 length:1569 start_codon:yes stop_codon:yes gene_type:complete
MPWTPEIIERMGMGGEPMFALDFEDAPNPDTFDYRPERYVLHTHGIGGGKHIAHSLLSVTGPTQSVQIRSWYPSIGAVRATLSGIEQAYWIARTIPRGMLCTFKVGFAGIPFDKWADVGIYQYRGMRGARNNWVMDFGDYFSYLQSRPAIGDYVDLFPDAGTDKEIAAGYTAASDTTLTFSSTADREVFTRDGAGGASGLLYAQPSSGDPFYLKHTGGSGANLTVTASDVIDTTRVNLASGDKVRALGYVNGGLTDILEKLLFRSTSSVGSMPDDSCLMLFYDATTVDRDDWVRQSNRLATIGGFTADFIAAAPLTNPWVAISDFFGAFGLWLVMRQGRLSFRTATDCDTGTDETLRIDAEITDLDIVSVEDQTLYHPDAREQMVQVNFPITAFGETGGKAITMPSQGIFRHPSIEHVYGGTANKTNARTHLSKRLLKWYTRIPMSITLNLLGWRWSTLVPGDIVQLKSNTIPDLIGPVTSFDTIKPITDRVFMVTSIAPDFANFTTSITLTQLPPKSNPYT